MMRCTIWYHLYKLKNVKNTHGGVLKHSFMGVFHLFSNCSNGTKSRNAPRVSSMHWHWFISFQCSPTSKKNDELCLKNYRPVSLLPICGKIPERLIFNEMFRFLIDIDFLKPIWFQVRRLLC